MITSCHQRGTKTRLDLDPDGIWDCWARYVVPCSARRPALCRSGAVSGLFAELARILPLKACREYFCFRRP